MCATTVGSRPKRGKRRLTMRLSSAWEEEIVYRSLSCGDGWCSGGTAWDGLIPCMVTVVGRQQTVLHYTVLIYPVDRKSVV